MIIVSLLLILVAVVLLVLGLSAGSSALIIGSIVVSLLAASVLVIGARQAANMRRAAMGEPTGPSSSDPLDGFDRPADFDRAGDHDDFGRADDRGAFARADDRAFDRAGDLGVGEPQSPYGPDPTFADSPPATEEGLASPVREKPRVASPEDAAAALAADAAYRERVARESAFGSPSSPETASAYSASAEEFGAADDEDPADEPPPQAVRPADLVQVARMNAEVLVVDGRPRYHLADCPHLVGKVSEALPAAEAVELGFSPCGLCRPVDRLVAWAH